MDKSAEGPLSPHIALGAEMVSRNFLGNGTLAIAGRGVVHYDIAPEDSPLLNGETVARYGDGERLAVSEACPTKPEPRPDDKDAMWSQAGSVREFIAEEDNG